MGNQDGLIAIADDQTVLVLSLSDDLVTPFFLKTDDITKAIKVSPGHCHNWPARQSDHVIQFVYDIIDFLRHQLNPLRAEHHAKLRLKDS